MMGHLVQWGATVRWEVDQWTASSRRVTTTSIEGVLGTHLESNTVIVPLSKDFR